MVGMNWRRKVRWTVCVEWVGFEGDDGGVEDTEEAAVDGDVEGAHLVP